MLLLHQPEQSLQVYWCFYLLYASDGSYTFLGLLDSICYLQCLLYWYFLCFIYLLTIWVAENMLCQMVGSVTDNELEMTWKKAWQFELLLQHLPEVKKVK